MQALTGGRCTYIHTTWFNLPVTNCCILEFVSGLSTTRLMLSGEGAPALPQRHKPNTTPGKTCQICVARVILRTRSLCSDNCLLPLPPAPRFTRLECGNMGTDQIREVTCELSSPWITVEQRNMTNSHLSPRGQLCQLSV